MLRRLLRNSEGSVFVIVALSTIAVVAAAGVAVDTARGQLVLARLQNSVDAAALAAGATLSTNDISAVANKYISLNFSQNNLGATLENVTATLSEDKKTVTVSASADVPTTIMGMFDHNTMQVASSSEVVRSNKGLEVALVLDTTGSMQGSKLTALKTAAHDLVDILFGEETTQENLWIGVVPFSQAVNIGTSRAAWLNQSHYNSLIWNPTSWAGCVEARYTSGRDVTDDPPYDLADPTAATPASPYERLKAYYAPVESGNWSQTSSNQQTLCSNKSSCTCANYGPCVYTVVSTVSASRISCTSGGSNSSCYKYTYTYATPSTSSGPNTNCPAAITPLTNTKSTVEAGIDALQARGFTHVNLGAVWGWRLISPRWRGYWGGAMNTEQLPLDYNTPLMSKAVVLMTDGANTTTSYSAYPSGSGITSTQLNTKLSTVCNAMKAQGVVVYTILFMETNPTIKDLMRNCATSPDYFFDSPTAAALQSAFQTIGDSLANLRISK